MPTLVYSKDFTNAVRKLDTTRRGRVLDTLIQFQENPDATGLNLERLAGCADSKMCSIRVDQGFRIILCQGPQQNSYIFLYVDQHDEAYKWAKKRKVTVNEEMQTIQMYTCPDEEPAQQDAGLFPAALYSDRSLQSIGVPREQLPLVRAIRDETDLQEQLSAFPAEVQERLEELATGTPLSVVQAEVEENKAAAAGDPAQNPDTLRSYAFGPIDPELKLALTEGSLEEWRVFLHPAQRQQVRERFDGPALVLGGAGTGKTITALHRAKALAARMIAEKTEGKILFTFYTANLIDDIESKLRSICTCEELNRIDVQNIDKVANQLTQLPDYAQVEVLYPGSNAGSGKLTQLWNDAIAASGPENAFPAEFYQREWERIVTEQDAFTLEEYLKVRRTGSGKPLYSEQRKQIWKVFDAYRQLMQKRRQMDYKTAMHQYRQYVLGHPDKQYRHIIVDETQDFSAGALRLLRALAGPQREDDLFLVGDTRQKIYDRHVSLSRCGIQVQGRTRRLWLNYRTTYELQNSATQLLEGESFDDLNGELDSSPRYLSCTSGAKPQVKFFSSGEEETQWILDELQNLINSGVPSKDICLAAYTNKMAGAYIKQLNDSGIRTYELKRKDDRGLDGVRVGTMHRVKGLEFQCMFISGINKDVFPPKAAGMNREILKQSKCLLYVALTRAQKGAYVSGYGRAPSEFLSTLEKTAL